MSHKWVFNIVCPSEIAAGNFGYNEVVTIDVENDPGGDTGDFERYMSECLSDWFDGASVIASKEK